MPTAQHIAVAVTVGLTLASPALAPETTPTNVSLRTATDSPAKAIDVEWLDAIIQRVSTITEYTDGRVEHNDGYGFVAGEQFITVNHNLESSTEVGRVRKTSYIDGIPLSPRFGDAEEDLAVFDLPSGFCESNCDKVRIDRNVEMHSGQRLFWLRKAGAERELKEGRVIDYAWIGESPESDAHILDCPGNLIVRIDRPFLQGSSGSPIVDAATGEIVGIIQGTLIGSDGTETGFFKPVNCLKKADRLSAEG